MNEQRLQSVAEIQKDFVYDKHAAGDYTIYHCHRPDSGSYAFEIVLGKMGIYVGGDINSLSYRVARGLEFLAGDDVDYYQHSKLEYVYLDKKELDPALLKKYKADMLWEAFDEDYDIEGLPEKQPDTLEEIVKFYEDHRFNLCTYQVATSEVRPCHRAWELYYDLGRLENLQEIYQKIYDSEYHRCGEMPCIDKAADSVMFCMYMVHHAAKKILEQNK
jgi:hypothetical protein